MRDNGIDHSKHSTANRADVPPREDGGHGGPCDQAVTFNHPDQVLADGSMTKSEKRVLLASWASDRHAVENAPALRRINSGAFVTIDEILGAMATLDAADEGAEPERPPRLRYGLGPAAGLALRLVRRRDDRDDDPPPTASASARPFSPIFTEALAMSA
ncbi:hypothetical protein ASG43_19990 [Aureimonas sp. Leaf454]|nr:hypothetical protein ASG43_19990 [Aureimonas sp. Leaf454]